MSKVKKFQIEIEVPVVVETKTSIPVQFHVEGWMRTIKRHFKTKEEQDLLDEYAKFYIMKEAKLEYYPIKEKLPIAG